MCAVSISSSSSLLWPKPRSPFPWTTVMARPWPPRGHSCLHRSFLRSSQSGPSLEGECEVLCRYGTEVWVSWPRLALILFCVCVRLSALYQPHGSSYLHPPKSTGCAEWGPFMTDWDWGSREGKRASGYCLAPKPRNQRVRGTDRSRTLTSQLNFLLGPFPLAFKFP